MREDPPGRTWRDMVIWSAFRGSDKTTAWRAPREEADGQVRLVDCTVAPKW
jgi:hypothetical protein